VELFHNNRSPLSQCLSSFVERLLFPNIIPELCLHILLEEASRRVSVLDLVHNHLGKLALLRLWTCDVGYLVFPHERTEMLIPRVIVYEVSSPRKHVVLVWFENPIVVLHGCDEMKRPNSVTEGVIADRLRLGLGQVL